MHAKKRYRLGTFSALFLLCLLLKEGSIFPLARAVDDSVQDAIDKSRNHLENHTPVDSPYAFPNTRYRLALMLESKLPSLEAEVKKEILKECSQLYKEAGLNSTSPMESSKRIASLFRAAEIILDDLEGGDITHPESSSSSSTNAESLLWLALDIPIKDGSEEANLAPLYATVFEKLIRQLLSKASIASQRRMDNKKTYFMQALKLCDKCAKLAPMEPVIDEYKGVVLREYHGTSQANAFLLDSSLDKSAAAREVYRSYEEAANKSHSVAMNILAELSKASKAANHPYGSMPKLSKSAKAELENGLLDGDEDATYTADAWNRLIRHIILAACSAREAGLSNLEERHWKYGLEILSSFASGFSAIKIAPEVQADLYTNVGIHHKKLNKKKRAAEYFQKALQVHPGDGHAVVQLASIEHSLSEGVARLDDSYVAGLFDGYSQRFERELVVDLKYKGHELVADAVLSQQNDWLNGSSSSPPAGSTVTIVDVGCGTGLLGELFRKRLHDSSSVSCATSGGDLVENSLRVLGVDLSPRMVDLSRSRTIKIGDTFSIPVYDEVEVSDAAKYLGRIETDTINAIVASDVFIYVGALEDIFRECSRVLHPSGLLSFTVELPEERKHQGVKLLKSGRFGHSRSHIEQIAHEHGFLLEVWEDAVLRTQGGSDVSGAVVVLKNASK